MNLLLLYGVFARIGLLTIGGGYAMIPLIRQEILSRSWMTPDEFASILGFSEMTPGPIAVNAATFVGLRVAGPIGGLAATLGVITPSLVIILVLSRWFFAFRDHPIQRSIFAAVRPVVTGMITAASVIILLPLAGWTGLEADLPALLLFGLSLILFIQGKIPPPLVLLGSALAGWAVTALGF